jgi:hypothetical protein
MIEKCRFCEGEGELVLSTWVADYSCQICGEWQDAILGSCWEILKYREVSK